MGDPRRYWKESIGVTRKPRPRAPAPGDPGVTGPVTGTVPPPGERKPADPSDSAATGPVTGPAGTPAPGTDPAHPLSPEALAALERALDSLPVGTLSFAREVERLLWRDPRPEDLVAISRIAGDRHLLPRGPLRQAVLAALAVRAQAELLSRTFECRLRDPGVAVARAGLAEKLADRTRELAEQLVAEEGEPWFELVGLARGLLPPPERLLGLARIARAVGNLLADLAADAPPPRLSRAPERETIDLLAAFREGRPRPLDELFLAVLAVLAGAENHLARGSRREVLADRVALAELWDRLEAAVDRVGGKHERNPEALARLAAWRRALRGMRGRLDEFLTAPAEGGPTGPVAGSSRPPRPEVSSPEGETAPAPPAPGDEEEAIRDRLREVRLRVEPAGEGPPRRRGLLRWLLFGGLLGILGLSLGLVVLPAPPPPPLPVDLPALRAGAPLLAAKPAGRLLVAVVDPAWSALPAADRLARTTRLAALAEDQGFRAGILLSPTGTPVATWSPGSPPLLRELPGGDPTGVAAALLPETRAFRWPRHGGGTYLGTDG